MNCIRKITDEDLGLESVKFNNPRIRLGARGIVIRDNGDIAVFNKTVKNEYKLPGGGIDEDEEPREAFKREVLEETGCTIEIINELGFIEELKSLDNFMQKSFVFVGRVIEDTHNFELTEKEKAEGARLLWCKPDEALKLIENCSKDLKASAYENLYHSKFICLRDQEIMKTYLSI
ncbi:MAG: NUDIX domain-containing protein [Bacilli bacterium]